MKKVDNANYIYNSVDDIDNRLREINNGDDKFSLNKNFKTIDWGYLNEVLKNNDLFLDYLLELDEIDRRFSNKKFLGDLKKTIFDIIDIAKHYGNKALKQTVLAFRDIVFNDFSIIGAEENNEEINKLNTVLKHTLTILKLNKNKYFLEEVFTYHYIKGALLNELVLLNVLKDSLIKEKNDQRREFLRKRYIRRRYIGNQR